MASSRDHAPGQRYEEDGLPVPPRPHPGTVACNDLRPIRDGGAIDSPAERCQRCRIRSKDPMTHDLISLTEHGTLPIAFSSLRVAGTAGWIYASPDFAIVIEERPLSMLQVAAMMMKDTSRPPEADMKYVAAANVFYRKSRNPHGPSSRPIYVIGLEHSSFSTPYDRPGLLARLLGAAPRPQSVFVGLFSSRGHENFGSRPNDFTRESARDLLLDLAARQVGLSRSDFKFHGDVREGPQSTALA